VLVGFAPFVQRSSFEQLLMKRVLLIEVIDDESHETIASLGIELNEFL
jgi:hypothetical protein